MMSKSKADKTDLPPENIILFSVIYQLLLLIVDSILLGRFKLGDEVLDVSGLGSIFSGHGADGDFILYVICDCRVELLMGRVEISF